MKRRILNIIVVGIALLALITSCAHRELRDPQNTHYVRIYLDEQIKNVTCGFYNESLERPEYERPTVLRAILANQQTGEVVSERILRNSGEDAKGHYIDGHIAAKEGVYNFMVYELGSSITLLRDEDNYYGMEAYTNPVNDYLLQYIPATRNEVDNKNIVNAPEHLFHCACQEIKISNSTETDTIKNVNGDYFTARSIAKSYYIQVNVKGFEYITSAASLLNGVAGSVFMSAPNELNAEDSVHLFFGMNYTGKRAAKSGESTVATLYATFNTFGKIPDIPSIYALNFEFMKRDGTSQVVKIDITDLFETPMVKENQWIILDHMIEITPPEGENQGGGMRPGVDEWKDIESEIIM